MKECPTKRDHLKGNESSSNHHFSGDMLIFSGLFEVQVVFFRTFSDSKYAASGNLGSVIFPKSAVNLLPLKANMTLENPHVQ